MKELQELIYNEACKRGCYDTAPTIHELLCHLYSEVTEVYKAYKDNNRSLFKEELADVIILTLSICGYLDIDIDCEVTKKRHKNKERIK